MCVPGPPWRLLSGLAGAGREPPGLSVPERCECSLLASKLWSRQHQAPVLSSAAAQIRGQLRRHVLAVLRSPERVKPRNLGAGCDPRDRSLFGVFLRDPRLLHPDLLWAPAQHRAQRSAAIQGNRRAERLWEFRQPGKWVPWEDAGRRIPGRKARVNLFGGAPCQSLTVLVMGEWMNADCWLWGSSFSTSIQMLTSASAAGTPFLSDSGGHSPGYWVRSFELRAGAPWGRLPVAQPIGGGSGRASLGCLVLGFWKLQPGTTQTLMRDPFLGRNCWSVVRQHPQRDGDAGTTALGRQWLWSGIPMLAIPHQPQRLAQEGSPRAWG